MTVRYVWHASAQDDSDSTWNSSTIAYLTPTAALAASTNADVILVAHDHSNQYSGVDETLAFPTSPGLQVICVNRTSGALATTAVIGSTGNNIDVNLSGFGYIYGIHWTFGTAANNNQLRVGFTNSVAHGFVLEQCSVTFNGAGGVSGIQLGPAASTGNDGVLIRWNGGTWTFSGQGQDILPYHARIFVTNVVVTGTVGTAAAMTFGGSEMCQAVFEGCDLSGLTAGFLADISAVGFQDLTVRDCKFPSFGTGLTTGTIASPGGSVVRVHNCDSGDTNYNFHEVHYSGAVVDETTLVRSGGQSDGTTPLALKMTSNASATFGFPLRTPEGVLWNETVGSAVTLTFHYQWDSATDIDDDELWVEVMYLGTSGFPLGVTDISSRAASPITTPSAQSGTGATWTGTGMTNQNTNSIAVTFTPREVGFFHFRWALAKPSTTVYVDMKPAIS